MVLFIANHLLWTQDILKYFQLNLMWQLHVDIEGPTETILELLVRQYSVIIVVNFLDPFIYFFKPEPVFD